MHQRVHRAFAVLLGRRFVVSLPQLFADHMLAQKREIAKFEKEQDEVRQKELNKVRQAHSFPVAFVNRTSSRVDVAYPPLVCRHGTSGSKCGAPSKKHASGSWHRQLSPGAVPNGLS